MDREADLELAALGFTREGGAGERVLGATVAPLPELSVPGPMELWAFAAGVKPVVFLTVEAEREAAIVARVGGAHVERYERRVKRDARDRWTDDRNRGEPRVELYVARDAALARRTAALQIEGDPTRDAVELGGLLGYPRCCVDAFVRQPDRADNTRNRYLAAARTTPTEAIDAPWPWQLNELHARVIPFYPCSYRCEAAVAFADAALGALEAAHPGARAKVREALRRTVLYLDHGRQVWLGRERDQPVHRVGDSPGVRALAAVIAGGDAVTLDEDALTIQRDGVVVARYVRSGSRLGMLARFA